MEDSLEWMALSQLPGIGTVGFWQIVEHFGSPGAALAASMEVLHRLPGVRSNQLSGFAARDTTIEKCRRQRRLLVEMGAEILTYVESDYPRLLKEMKDPPPVLYLLGDRSILNSCCLGIVGSRAASSYGRRTAFSLAKRLAEHGVTIISGLALGIDAESHRGALAAAGKTIAVLGCGIDIVYPRQNKQLFEMISKKGAIISENPPTTAPEGFRFPARNRIIAGMSRGVLVVEAAKKSGSLITAQIAVDAGRDVFAVPGQVDSLKSEGTHWLLQQGAKLVQSERDVIDELSCYFDGTDKSEVRAMPSSLDPETLWLLEYIEPYPCPRDELIRKTGRSVAELSELLLVLELEGQIEILPGDEIRRLVPIV